MTICTSGYDVFCDTCDEWLCEDIVSRVKARAIRAKHLAADPEHAVEFTFCESLQF